MTADPDLHLVVDGRRIRGKARARGLHVFSLTARPSQVRIVSRACVPQEVGTARDPRCLGVALRRIVVRRGAWLRVVEGTDPSLTEGFHLFEEVNGFRWTNGDAVLPPVLFHGLEGGCELELHVGCMTQYPLFGAVGAPVAA